MKIGNIECKRGERAFGFLEVDRTVSEIRVQIPINILCGPEDGPTLVVDAAIHGNENVGSVAMGQFLRNIDVNEIGIELQYYAAPPVTYAQRTSPLLRAKARHPDSNWDVTLDQNYLEKPWVDNFATYAGLRPDQQFIVARSRRACTSENEARDQERTQIIDYTGRSKGTSAAVLARVLNVPDQDIIVQPDPAREVDFRVILGYNYDSCTYR